jgi:hypothetical protein
MIAVGHPGIGKPKPVCCRPWRWPPARCCAPRFGNHQRRLSSETPFGARDIRTVARSTRSPVYRVREVCSQPSTWTPATAPRSGSRPESIASWSEPLSYASEDMKITRRCQTHRSVNSILDGSARLSRWPNHKARQLPNATSRSMPSGPRCTPHGSTPEEQRLRRVHCQQVGPKDRAQCRR